MDMRRAFLAIIISFVILLGYQYFFIPATQPPVVQPQPEQIAVDPSQTAPTIQQAVPPAATSGSASPEVTSAVAPQTSEPVRQAKDVTLETNLFTATISERGGTITSFRLKEYREENNADAAGVQLITTTTEQGLPLTFSWGTAVPPDTLYTLAEPPIQTAQSSGDTVVTLHATTSGGLEIERRYTFRKNNYLIDHTVIVRNKTGQVLQGAATLQQRSTPAVALTKSSKWLFRGPAYYDAGGLHEIKLKELEAGKQTVPGDVDWIAYEGTYFMRGIIPATKPTAAITLSATGELVSIEVQNELDTIAPGTEKTYSNQLFYGPKKLSVLKQAGTNLAKIVNFGWFDVIAKPTLYLLNWFYAVFHNYGIAIILVTVLLKTLFWPITQKGLKSMKNMQKLQPKMAKIKEKYKSDPSRMNQEMMNLYKTYKVNPLGGCLPMVLQIPVFFALYKVLLQSIELRHAPFMLWITDLSAPDRLFLGFDLPYLGGLPVLTLLMGASMFLQQKMTPTTADPTQAKIMLFLPLVFTVMFVNFASGLVLYWFVNNLLSILQQYLINRQRKTVPATD